MNYSKKGPGKQNTHRPLRLISPRQKYEANSKDSLNDICPHTSGGSMRNLQTTEQVLQPLSKNIPLKFKMLKVYRTYIHQNSHIHYNQELEGKITSLTQQLTILKAKNKALRDKTSSFYTLKQELRKVRDENSKMKREKINSPSDPLDDIMIELKNSIIRIQNTSK